MYKLVFSLAILALAMLGSCKQLKDPIDCGCDTKDSVNLNKDLILYYNFEDGSAKDISGNNNDGFLQNETYKVNGKQGNGLRLVGKGISTNEGGHVDLPIINFSGLGDFSISLWVFEENWTYEGGNAYFSWGDETSGILGIFSQWGRPRYDLSRHTKFSVGSTWSYYDDNSDPNNILMLDKSYSDSEKLNTWVFYALNYKNGVIYAYRNGEMIGSLAQKVKIGLSKGGINRHWWHNGAQSSSRMTGIVDEFRVYKRALNDNEIKRLYFTLP